MSDIVGTTRNDHENDTMERSITPEQFNDIRNDAAAILDIRRADDYNDSADTVTGAEWKNPADIDSWIGAVPTDGEVIIYCVRGGGVSNSVVDRLQAEGINARFIEGGIEALKSLDGMVGNK